MTDPVGVRRNILIAAVVVAVVLGAGLGAVAVYGGPPGPCSSPNPHDPSCPAEVTLSQWCAYGTPCPFTGTKAVVQGYTFVFSGYTFGNGTLAVEGAVATPNSTSPDLTVFVYHFTFWSDPFGMALSWTSSDGRVFASWPAMPIGPVQPPLNVTLICGVAATPIA